MIPGIVKPLSSLIERTRTIVIRIAYSEDKVAL
jgi:hypothetical protein